ncbi:cupin domain-containing protein [Croceibacterium aestuarii]|uniref:cupin domain-containing protein n=1 Tax=Croceibacterium aestuarii TaxID=3064139 RepID=UPI00272E5093|nr:cupin domain-containing protein [Croceibacterium sp. D39]
MPKLDLDSIAQTNATGYPSPYDKDVAGRWVRRLRPAAGLTELGAAHVVLKPGAWSSQRHWHAEEDELVVILSGEAVLVEDAGETIMRAGDIAAWPKGERNGHCLQNRSDADCVMLALSAGDTARDHGEYPDIDLKFDRAGGYLHKDGTPYPPKD